jgi:phage terminase large subunit GpA-like protein
MFIDPCYLANAARLGWGIAAQALKPPPPLDYVAWAKSHVRFGNESQFSGAYNPALFPYFTGILEALGPEHAARVILLMKSAQLGGTVLAQIFTAASLDLDPGPMLYTHPTEMNAARWAKTKWRVMLRQIKHLAQVFRDSNSREPGASLLYQERRDGRGSIIIGGANSEASLSMISVARQVQDDLAKWELNRAGDPEVQADSRSMAFLWAKIFKIGTPLLEDSCRITRNWRRSSQHHFEVVCPHCGHDHPLLWENLEPHLEPDHPERAAFHCPACGAAIEEHQRMDVVRTGQWKALRPGAAIWGFYLWSAYSPLVSLQQIAEAWFKAKGDPASEQSFYNDWLGLAYRGATEAPAWEVLRDRAEASGHRRGCIPPGFPLLCIGVDCQDDRVEVHVVAFGRELRRAVVDYIVIAGHISTDQARKALDGLLLSAWPDAFGNKRPADMLAIDGNAWTEDVADWVKRHPQSRVIMVRGVKSDLAVPLARVKRERRKDGALLKYAKRFFNVGASPLKTALYKNLKKEDPAERSYVAIPAGLGDEYFEQLCAEVRKPLKLRGGGMEYRWVLPDGKRNEALDTAIYAEAAAIRAGFRANTEAMWDRLESERDLPPVGGAQGDLEDLLRPGHVPPPLPGAADKPAKESAAARRARLTQGSKDKS